VQWYCCGDAEQNSSDVGDTGTAESSNAATFAHDCAVLLSSPLDVLVNNRVDYSRMGEEYAALDMNQPGDSVTMPLGSSSSNSRSHLQCLLLELELGLVGVSMCVGIDCMVIAIASPSAPLGMVKARLQAITEYVQEALSPLTTEGSYG
jgi:hypothetical protein